MNLPKAFQLLKVKPNFVRDNQYDTKYTVIDEIYDKEEFVHLETLYPESVCEFPSGKRCFFLLNCDRFDYDGDNPVIR